MSDTSKVAVVTGASQGIGAGVAAAFRRQGYQVVGTSRSIAPSRDDDFVTIQGDIGDPDTGTRVIDEALSRFGRVDTLVNNAGIFIGGPFTGYTPQDYRRMLGTNLDGFFHITQRAVAAMERQGAGHIVQITTTLAEKADARFPSVLAAMTKGGLIAATRSLAIEYAGRGIRANAVSAGVIKTPMHAEDTHADLAAKHPLQRLGEIEDIVRAILYLEASPFVTGDILHVDGGWSAGG